MCVPLAVAAAAVSAAGSLAGGFAGMQQAGYESRVARQNARLDEEQARDSLATGRVEARDFYRHLAQVKGQQVASLAANGVDLSFGTPAEALADTAWMGGEDAESLYHNQLQRLRGYDAAAANDRAQASAEKYRGRVGMLNSVLQAGSSLMTGFSQQARMRPVLGLTGG